MKYSDYAKRIDKMAESLARKMLDHYHNDMTKEEQENFDKMLDDLKQRGF